MAKGKSKGKGEPRVVADMTVEQAKKISTGKGSKSSGKKSK